MRSVSASPRVCLVVSSVIAVSLAVGFRCHPASAQSDTAASSVLHVSGDVQSKNDDWLRTGVRLQAGDVVSIVAQGKVTLGQYTRDIGPIGGVNGDGELDAKVGSADDFGVGAHYAFVDSTVGILKLRVRDTRRDDNAGSFHVDVYVIRAAGIPSEMAFRDED